MPTDPTRDGRQRRYVLSPDLLGVGSAGGAWTRMGVQIGPYHGSACYATSPPVLRCWSLGWPRPGRYVVPSKSSPRPGPRRTENVDGEGVRRDPCGQNPRRRCAMRVRPVPDCQAALGLSARRRSADLQRTDRPGSSVGSWTTSPAAIQMYTNERISMYTNERISDLEARWSRCSCCISSGVTMLPNPPGAALDAVVPEGASPVREHLSNAGYVKRWGPPRSRSNGSAVPWADVGRILRRRGPARDR